jgi:hypothetical protein
MYGRSDAFDAAIIDSHNPRVVADLLFGGDVVVADLPIIGGNVQVDGSAAIRRRCNLTLVDDDGTLTPNDSSDALSPYGREVRIRRGVQLLDGSLEYVPVGTFRISTVDVNDAGNDRKLTIAGFDRARSISRARFESPYVIAAGTNYATAIRDLLISRLPNIQTSFISTAATTPLLVIDQGADPWETAQTMAIAIGCELFFDPSGVCVLKVPTDPSTTTVDWNYGRGQKATVIAITNSLSDEPGYNGVVVDGEPPNADPVHEVVYDRNPLSPTNADGPYGKVPIFYKSQFITTSAQAIDAANSLLLAKRGGTEQVKFTAIPHPAHEVNDLVHVDDDKIGVNDSYVLESFTMPLDLGVMQATTRKRRTA